MSPLSGQGVDQWLEFVARAHPAGGKIAEVDYDTYAAGEAALGWLNASATLEARDNADWQAFVAALLEAIRQNLVARGAQIAHLKLYLAASGASTAGNITGNNVAASVRGEIPPTHRKVRLTLNARVHVQPDVLREVVEQSLLHVAGKRIAIRMTNIRSFFPARPEPTHRFGQVV
jgi:hypothetical protein